eukprot:SM000333S12556  [mRNA]  locus=s333:75564:79742:+ [translate_table: standard]
MAAAASCQPELPPAYGVYRALTAAASPLLALGLRLQAALDPPTRGRLRGRTNAWAGPRCPGRPARWPGSTPSRSKADIRRQTFGAASCPGEGMAAVALIQRCRERLPALNVLLTTSTMGAWSVLHKLLPSGTLLQFAPIDSPAAVHAFLEHWRPNALVLVESELWPNLVTMTASQQIPMALVNAQMSPRSFRNWRAAAAARSLVSLMLASFSLILPLDTVQATRLQLLGARPHSIRFAGDLKYATTELLSQINPAAARTKKDHFKQQLQPAMRKSWLAASTHSGEEEIEFDTAATPSMFRKQLPGIMGKLCFAVVAQVHERLSTKVSGLLTVIAPRQPERGNDIAKALLSRGLRVARRTMQQPVTSATDIYLVDTLGELQLLYAEVAVAFVGGSLLPHCCGHNLAEAAAAGCAVLTGKHVGHFSSMIATLQRLDPLSLLQVSNAEELEDALQVLLSDNEALHSRQAAARAAASSVASRILDSVCEALESATLKTMVGLHAHNMLQ